MPEPMILGTVSSATQVFSGFNHYFKPSRSPYLLTGLLCVVSLVSISGLANSQDIFFLAFLPVGGIFTALSILCFFFKPRKSVEGPDVEKIKAEMDEEFKFSRTVCLSVGVLVLTYLFYKLLDQPFISLPFSGSHSHVNIPRGIFFWVSYLACLFHLAIFVCYVLLRNIQEEKVVNLSLFQITFFTVAALLGLVLSGSTLQDQESWFYSCQNQVTYTRQGNSNSGGTFLSCDEEIKKQKLEEYKQTTLANHSDATDFASTSKSYLNPEKLLFWFFLIHLLAFELFWLSRFKSIVRFKFDLVVVE